MMKNFLKAGFSPSKKVCFIFFNDSPLNMMKNAFYFIIKALFVLKIFKILFNFCGHIGKRLDKEAKDIFKIYDVTT